MTDDDRAAWMTPPPELVRGCDSPEGVRVLADWLDEHGGDGAEFREQQRDLTDEMGDPDYEGDGYGDGGGYGDPSCEGDGKGSGPNYFDTRTGDGYGYGFSYGGMDGDGGPDSSG